MTIQKLEHFDLAAIAQSGQCFRWERKGPGYRIIAMDKVLYAEQNPAEGTTFLSCSEEEYLLFWKRYFDLETDYQAIMACIPTEDTYLRKAALYGHGIRILRQEPWETLITFILSQRKSIPAIKQNVSKLCAAGGKCIGEEAGETLYAFPTPVDILRLPPETLKACGLGYRADYIHRTAEAFCKNSLSVQELRSLDDEALFNRLCTLYGVGRKIALCTMLFGFHRMNAFPVDVWMGKVEQKRYPNGIPIENYSPWAGVMQQYMFAYERHLAEGEKPWSSRKP